jgi:hypothetical protein
MNAPAGIAGTIQSIRRDLLRDPAVLRLTNHTLIRDAMSRYRCSRHVAMAAVDEAKRGARA